MRKIFSLLTAILFAGSMMATDYQLVNSTADLVAGAKYVIGTDAGSFISTESYGNNRKITTTTVTDGVVTATEAMMVFTLGGQADAWTFATDNYLGTAGYLNATSTTGSNYLKIVADLDNYAYFTVAIADGVTTITCNGKSSRHILYQNGTTCFACYNNQTGSQYHKPNLYKEVAGGGEEQEDTYTVAGIEALCGSSWDPADTNNDMVKQQDGTYKWEKADVTLSEGAAEFKVVKNHEWGEGGVNAYPANNYQLAIAEDGVYSVTIIFNPAAEENKISAEAVKTGGAEIEHTYTVAGNSAAVFGKTWNPALAANDMDLQQDGTYKWEKADVELAAGEIALKVVKDHSWDVAYPAQNYILNIAEAGVYTITVTFDPANDNAVNAVAQKAGGDDPEPPVVSSYIFDWTKGTGAQITADNTDLNANDMGTMAVGTSVVARRLGSNNIDNNAKGYKLANNDVCLEIKGTRDFVIGDTVVITGVCGGSGARAFAIAPVTTTNAVADTALTNTQENTSDILEYKVVVKEAQAGDKMRIFRMANKTMYIHSVKVLPYQAAPQPQTKDIQVVPGAWADYKLAAWAWEGSAEGAWYPVVAKNEQMIAEVPAAADHIIIVAFETTAEEFDWNTKIAQTSNQDIDACGVIYINNGNPTWCQPAEIVAEVYTVAGSSSILGVEWDTEATENDMTLNPQTGVYTLVKEGLTLAAFSYPYKVVKNHAWGTGEYPTSGNNTLNIPEDGVYTVTFTYNPNLATPVLTAEAVKTGDAEIERHYLVVGQGMVANGEDWNNDAEANLMTTADEGLTYTLTIADLQLIAGTDYRYKIVEKGTWDEYFPNLEGPDATFSVATDGIYTITYVYTVANEECTVQTNRTGDLPEPTLTNGYYIIGKFAGVEDWTVAGLTEAHRFILQNETEEGAFYQLTNVPLAVGDSFKVVSVKHDIIVRTWPEGSTEGVVIDANHAGEAKTIYLSFLTTGKWYCNVEPNIYDGYYLVGNIGGVETWTPVAANRFSVTEEEGEFLLHYTLAENDRIKVGYAYNGVITTWYPDGTDNEYVVDANHAGEKDIYFRPIYKAEWEEFGGHIWMGANAVSPIDHVDFYTGDVWAADNESSAVWDPETGKITVTLALPKVAPWQGQVVVNTVKPEPGKCYNFSVKMKANKNMGGVTIKWQENNNDPIMVSEINTISLVANTEFVYTKNQIAGMDGNGMIIYDFGYAEAGTVVEIYDLVIEETDCPDPVFYIAGSMTDWADNKVEMVADAEAENTYRVSIELDADSVYSFKVIKVVGEDVTWYGAGQEVTMEYGNSTNWELVGQANIGLHTTKADNYEFIFVNSNPMLISVVIPEPDPVVPVDSTTVYFINVPAWQNVNAYVWNNEHQDNYGAWPGNPMKLTEMVYNEMAVYSFTFPSYFDKIIFNGMNGETPVQTSDKDVIEATPYYYDGFWYASLEDIVPDVEIAFYISGSSNIVGAGSVWDPTAIPSLESSYTLHLQPGIYQLKISLDGTTDTWKGFSDLSNVAEGLTGWEENDAIGFTLAEEGDVVVTYSVVDEDTTFTVTGNFFTIESGYYLFNTETSSLLNLAAADKFAPNGEVEGEFVLNTTLVVGDNILVAEVSHNALIHYYVGEDPYIVDAAHAGDEKTVYFRPAGNVDWAAFGGYIYIEANSTTAISNTAVDAKAEKILRNGMILIIKGDKTYNVMGQIVK